VKLSSPYRVELAVSVPQALLAPAAKESDRACEFVTKTELKVDSPVTHQKKPQPAKAIALGTWGVFSSTFLTIFLAEMGDKTQLATLLMSAESHSPWVVFAGAATALVATSLLGVLIGRWLATRLSPKTLKTAAGALLLFISVSLLWDVVQLGG
jgi:putative Ca2+/H+ antiporter (TMEM165/GDT1 family)